ncbi:hypothetical protein Bca4012_061188 [Brassica carinata]
MRKLKQTLDIVAEETTSLSIEKEYGDKTFSPKEEKTRNRTRLDEPIGKDFTQAEYNIVRTKRSPVNPPKNLSSWYRSKTLVSGTPLTHGCRAPRSKREESGCDIE